MKRNKNPIGLKNNLDKILFLLSAIYLILVGVWFFKSNKLAANIKDSNSLTKTVIHQDIISTKNNEDNSPSSINQNVEINTKTNSDSPQVSSSIIEQNNSSISPLLLTQNTVKNAQKISSLNSLLTNSNSNEVNQINQVNSSFPQPIKVPMPPKLNNNIGNTNNTNNRKINTFVKVNSLPVLNSNSNLKKTQNTQKDSVNSFNQPTTITSFNTVKTVNENNTLVGLIQLENQSSIALFKIDNLTAKVKVGEEIGVSGWVLINADDKEAVISQNDQIIRLTVGDNF